MGDYGKVEMAVQFVESSNPVILDISGKGVEVPGAAEVEGRVVSCGQVKDRY